MIVVFKKKSKTCPRKKYKKTSQTGWLTFWWLSRGSFFVLKVDPIWDWLVAQPSPLVNILQELRVKQSKHVQTMKIIKGHVSGTEILEVSRKYKAN